MIPKPTREKTPPTSLSISICCHWVLGCPTYKLIGSGHRKKCFRFPCPTPPKFAPLLENGSFTHNRICKSAASFTSKFQIKSNPYYRQPLLETFRHIKTLDSQYFTIKTPLTAYHRLACNIHWPIDTRPLLDNVPGCMGSPILTPSNLSFGPRGSSCNHFDEISLLFKKDFNPRTRKLDSVRQFALVCPVTIWVCFLWQMGQIITQEFVTIPRFLVGIRNWRLGCFDTTNLLAGSLETRGTALVLLLPIVFLDLVLLLLLEFWEPAGLDGLSWNSKLPSLIR